MAGKGGPKRLSGAPWPEDTIAACCDAMQKGAKATHVAARYHVPIRTVQAWYAAMQDPNGSGLPLSSRVLSHLTEWADKKVVRITEIVDVLTERLVEKDKNDKDVLSPSQKRAQAQTIATLLDTIQGIARNTLKDDYPEEGRVQQVAPFVFNLGPVDEVRADVAQIAPAVEISRDDIRAEEAPPTASEVIAERIGEMDQHQVHLAMMDEMGTVQVPEAPIDHYRRLNGTDGEGQGDSG